MVNVGESVLLKVRFVTRNTILTELIPCLELYIPDVKGYLTSIMEDKNRWWKIDRPVCEITMMDLDAKPTWKKNKTSGEFEPMPSTLEQFRFTLMARLNVKRNEAGDTIHEMKIKAGVKCDCAPCRKGIVPALVPVAAGNDAGGSFCLPENW
jgi:hypothetical protein